MTDPLNRFYGGLNRVRRLCPDLPVLAIQWMAVKHPLYAVQERLLKASSMPEPARPFRRLAGRRPILEFGTVAARLGELPRLATWCLRCLAHAASLSTIIALLRWQLRRELATLKHQSFALIAKTWCFGPERLPGDRDFYYGDLQRRLAGRGVRMLLLCGNANWGRATLRGWRTFARAHSQLGEVPRLPALSLSPLFAPFRIAAQQVRASWRLGAIAHRARSPLLAAVSLAARRDAFSPQTMDNALLFWIAKSAVARWRPQAFVALYEANSWERCVWWGVKTAHAACRTVGYQHTVLFPYARSLLRPYVDARARSLPDIVLCLGRATRERLREHHEPHGVSLIPFGSFRHNGATPATSVPIDRRTILVVPEGILSEVQLLFGFVARCAGRLPEYTFILRCHPQIPMVEALERIPHRLAELPNVAVSDRQTIEEDFARASILLYRASSAVLYGILHGLLPIALHGGSPLEPDPLDGLTAWRRRCSTPEELEVLLRAHEHAGRDTLEAEWQTARGYVREHAGEVEESSIRELLTAVGLGGS